jgi:pyrimidine-specific ribonucleoside hydrolase
MKSKSCILLAFLGFIFYSSICFGDPIHKKNVVVDTDMGLDDARALAWLLKMDDLEIEAIISSDGALDPVTALDHINKVLDYFNKGEIMLGQGIDNNEPDPPFRSVVSSSFSNFPIPDNDVKVHTINDFYKTLGDAPEDYSLIYICLGPLSNLDYAVENNPGFLKKIEKVLYAGNNPDHNPISWNTNRNKSAAERVFNSIENIYEINISDEAPNFFNNDIISEISGNENDVTVFFSKIHKLAERDENKRHMFLYDDMIPLYLQYPEFFTISNTSYGKSIVKIKTDLLRSVYIDFVESGNILSSRQSVVFEKFPIDELLFKEDMHKSIDEIISMHGLEEWKAAVLTNEMHRHLGAYSLIGVKMGILARELLSADLDELSVVAYTDSKPPLSCLLDGLQVSTGASLGRGTITTIQDQVEFPRAVFIMNPKKIRVEIKPEIIKKIKSEIVRCSNKYGYGSNKYFTEIRKISIDFWVNLNRKHMFEVYDDMSGEKIF